MRGLLFSLLVFYVISVLISMINYQYLLTSSVEDIYSSQVSKRWVEDYISYISLKTKRFFPIKLEGNRIIFQYQTFSLPNVTVDDNVILFDNYYVKFSSTYSWISTNLSSSDYIFYFDYARVTSSLYLPGFRRIAIYSGDTVIFDKYVWYARIDLDTSSGEVTIYYYPFGFETINGTLYYVYPRLLITNPGREPFIIEVDEDMDRYNKTLLWKVHVSKDPYYYRGYVKWK